MTKRTQTLQALAALLIATGLAGSAQAAVITYDFEGQTKGDLDTAGWLFGTADGVDWKVDADPDDEANDVLRQDNGGIGNGGSGKLGAFAIAPDNITGSVDFSVDVRLDEDGTNDDAAVIFGWQDPDNYLFFLLNDTEFTDLFQVSNGNQSTLVDLGAPGVATAQWHSVEIVHDPDTSSAIVALNGTELYNGTDAAFATAGKIGMGNLNDAGSFDNLEIVPEPGTLALLGIGGLGVLLRRRQG